MPPPPFPAHYLQDERNQSKICRKFLEFNVVQLSTEYLLHELFIGKNAILYHSGRYSHGFFYNLALRNQARTEVDTKSIIYFAMSA